MDFLDVNFANGSSASSWANPYTYTGRRLDPETGLYYYRNRYYHAQLGRFVTRDPIGYEGSEGNLYEYVSSRPTRLTDPAGLQCPNYPPSGFKQPPGCTLCDVANRRRNHGPWRDSAQHCWAACYVGAVYGLGNVAAILDDIIECLFPSDDACRDIKAQHFGGPPGNAYNWAWLFGWASQTPEDYCDNVCQTWP